jgi:hypothetical protein
MTDYTYVKDTAELGEHHDLETVMINKDMVDWSAKKDYYASMKQGMNSNHACSGLHSIMAIFTWLAVMALLIALTRYFWKKAEK